jgi:hypothetical protein
VTLTYRQDGFCGVLIARCAGLIPAPLSTTMT